MLIAIIDDGICPLEQLNPIHDLCVAENGTVRERLITEPILTEHGTICAAIIRKYAPEAELCSIRIFSDETLKTSCDQLVSALNWCSERRIPIIHMSVGTSLLSDYEKIRPIVAKIIHQRQVIIAAHSNKDRYSLPACLSGVLGVAADKGASDDKYAVALSPTGRHTICASARHELDLPMRGRFTTPIANSYAAPTVTAAVYNMLSDYVPFSLTIPQFYNKMFAMNALLLPKPDYIQNAVLINPANRPILKQHLFFPLFGEYASLDEVPVDAACDDIIYLAPDSGSEIPENKEDMQKADGMFMSILYAGVLPKGYFPWKNTFLCDERTLQVIQEDDYDACVHPQCPVIQIKGGYLESLDILCQLRNLFMLDGYQCACVSNRPFSYLYNVEFASQAASSESTIRYVQSKYHPDVVMCHFSELDVACALEVDGICDHTVHIDCQDLGMARYAVNDGSHSFVPASYDSTVVQQIYATFIDRAT